MSNDAQHNTVIYLSSHLQNIVENCNEESDIHKLMDKLTKILYCVLVLRKYRHVYASEALHKNISLQFKVILRLVSALKKTFRESILYTDWDTHRQLKELYPEVYNAVINKRLDAKTAYSWCKEKGGYNGRKFIQKLMSVISPDEVVHWKNASCLNEEQIFIRELVRLTSKYQSSSILITSLNDRIKGLIQQLNEANVKIGKLEEYIKNTDAPGSVGNVLVITPLDDDMSGMFPLISVDGEGTGAVLYINNKTVAVADNGTSYVSGEIVSVSLKGKVYYLKVTEVIPEAADVAATVSLTQINFNLPLWTRLYSSLYPGVLDISVLMQIKQELTEYGVQYVILKHGSKQQDTYDEAMSAAF